MFSSIDPTLQSGPTAMNCKRDNGFFQPLTPMYCAELYRYDLDHASLRQLTGVGGSSTLHQLDPKVSDDGLSVGFRRTTGVPPTSSTHHRVDLASGAIEDLPEPACCRWDRGNHVVEWDPSIGALRSTDVATGEVTRVLGEFRVDVADVLDGARILVLAEYVSETKTNHLLLDTDLLTMRAVPSPWISEDLGHYLLLQRNVAPSGDDRIVLAPLPA